MSPNYSLTYTTKIFNNVSGSSFVALRFRKKNNFTKNALPPPPISFHIVNTPLPKNHLCWYHRQKRNQAKKCPMRKKSMLRKTTQAPGVEQMTQVINSYHHILIYGVRVNAVTIETMSFDFIYIGCYRCRLPFCDNQIANNLYLNDASCLRHLLLA